MKKKIIFTLVSLFLIFTQLSSISAYYPYDILNYHVDMTAHENGDIEIVETIDVYFNEERRGIYRNIPEHYNMEWEIDGKTYYRNYSWYVKDIDVQNESYEIDSDGGKSIRIGDANTYLLGEKQYIIEYTIASRSLDLPIDHQLFYLNAIPYEWDTMIQNSSFTIQYYQDVDFSEFFIYSTAEHFIDCSYDETNYKTSCSTNVPLSAYDGITVSQKLPADYFTYPNYDYLLIVALGVGVIATVVMIFMFIKYGKDKRVIETVEFTAPDGLTSAACGYILDGDASNEDVTSLFIEWGRDGYLKIEEISEDNLKLSKLKEMGKERVGYERRLFNQLFKSKDETTTKELDTTLGTAVQRCKRDISVYFNAKKRQLYNPVSAKMQGVSLLIIMVPLLIGLLGVYLADYLLYDILTFAIIILITLLFNFTIWVYVTKSFKTSTISKKIFYIALIALFGVITMRFLFSIYSVTHTGIDFFILMTPLTVINFILCVFMTKRSDYGTRVYGQVLGLRKFIMTAEQDRLEVLAKDNPFIFYDILPYAYAFKLTDVWNEHFKNISIPDNTFYTGYTPGLSNYLLMRSFARSMSTVQASAISIPKPTVSSGGGGFGGGGGGFSGGGFGGGGGGSW